MSLLRVNRTQFFSICFSLMLSILPVYAEGPIVLQEGIQAYRDGDYQKANKIFHEGHQQHPEDSRVTYYLAIAEAQLGHFKQAKALYQEILTLDPNSEAAQLAQEGLSYLPNDEGGLDRPPRFQVKKSGDSEKTAAAAPANTAPSAQNGGMSMQDMMMWQTLMGQMGNGNNNQQGMNASGMLPFMMMPQGTGDSNNAPSIDPNVMSNLLMNQMMQHFNLGGNSEENR